jgi:hypothetical protein
MVKQDVVLNIFKAYEVVEAGHPDYLTALSYTINQFSADRFAYLMS